MLLQDSSQPVPCCRDLEISLFLREYWAKPEVINEALGHASVAFTMDTYSYIIEGMQEDAMALLDEVLPAGISHKINARSGTNVL